MKGETNKKVSDHWEQPVPISIRQPPGRGQYLKYNCMFVKKILVRLKIVDERYGFPPRRIGEFWRYLDNLDVKNFVVCHGDCSD